MSRIARIDERFQEEEEKLIEMFCASDSLDPEKFWEEHQSKEYGEYLAKESKRIDELWASGAYT